jgi:hypothetical protein
VRARRGTSGNPRGNRDIENSVFPLCAFAEPAPATLGDKMTKVIAILVASFLVAACAAGDLDEQRRVQYLTDNPELRTTTVATQSAVGKYSRA